MSRQPEAGAGTLTPEVTALGYAAPKLLMSPKEAAKWIGVSEDTLAKARNAGLVAPRKLLPSDNRATWYSVLDLIRLVEGMEKG